MKYETCTSCNGSGMAYTGEDVVTCYDCKGNGAVPARDDKGRFMPYKREIFVFGSNLAGIHGAGSAKYALDYYGATFGQGQGLQGNSYAVPTKGANVYSTLPLDQIKIYVDQLMEDATERTDLEFMITRIGTGNAGYDWDRDIRPLFPEVLPGNCRFIDTTPPT